MIDVLPPQLALDKVKERFNKAFELEDKWYSLNSDVYEHFLPQRDIFNTTETGDNKMGHIFDSTPLESIQEGASRIVANIAPPWRRWAKIEPSDVLSAQLEEAGDEVDVSIDQIRENLDKQARIAFDYINRSNFATQFYEMCLDLLIGTATIKIDEEDSFDMPFSFHSIPPKGIAFEEGVSGTVENHWRKFKLKARNIQGAWNGFKPSPELKDKIENQPDTMIDLCEGVVKLDDVYYSMVWVKGEDSYSWAENLGGSSPFVTGRWSKTAGEVRGRGVAMQCYPDARTLNKAKQIMLQKAAIDLAGMYTAVDDGVTNPYTITIDAGVVIPVGSNSSTNPSISRLDTSTNLNLSQFVFEDLRNSIRRAFFNDLRDPASPVRSATEVAIEARELAQRIGSAFGRLQTEVLVPILKRVFYILEKKGLVNVSVDGVATTFKFTSPLAAAQDQEDLLAIQQAVEFTAMTAGPEMVKASFSMEKFGEYAAGLTGMPRELVRSEQDRSKAIQSGAQMAMQQIDQGKVNEQ